MKLKSILRNGRSIKIDKLLKRKGRNKIEDQLREQEKLEEKLHGYRGETLLAYSNLSNCNEHVKQFQKNRPRTARVRRK